jgi:hypothetical protein
MPRNGAIIFSDLIGKLDAVCANFRKLSANSIISGKLWGGHIAHDLQESGEENERCEYYDHNESLRETAKNFLKRYAADILILVRILVMIA